ncbi:ABC transporter permease [Clostridium gasigenes]|uniref:ABC transporter permease n=1 Tax=Clostridium gasigenes TaxID=94869 RepID=UPI00162AF548|nr:ABC transporter permease [Clostridium gasigenes]MBB6624039.1 ABC transporter permease [Clostridium gasigenes]MBU3088337.1 ABC transporter permease [Clostridium gasigenes]MBU3133314.1 ABC transporter permease [Clostridium gasigenes]
MDFILRGLLSLKKRKSKGIILLAIMLIVCLVILSGFGIQSATKAAAVLARQKLGAEVTLMQDMQKTMEKMRAQQDPAAEPTRGKGITRASVPIEYLDQLKGLENIEGYSLENSTGANLGDGVIAVASETTETTTAAKVGGGQDGKMKAPVSKGDITLMGINDFSLASEINNGGGELVSGSAITENDLEKNVVMLEEVFAEDNKLAVGGTIKLKNPETSVEFEASIIGIYKTNSTVDDTAFRNTAMMPYNKIYAPYSLVNNIKGSDYTGKVDSIKFFLDDPVNVDKFIEEGKKTNIDFETFVLDGGTREYDQMMSPIENVASFSKITLVVVTVFGAGILGLIIMLSIKERINEIGILMSLGEKRIRIIGQFLVEVLVILVIALSVAAFTGSSISKVATDKLLANELQTESQKQSQGMGGQMPQNIGRQGNGGGFSKTKVEKIEELNVKITATEFFQMALLAMLVVIVATIIPSLMIMSVNPKEILSKNS